MYLEAIRMWPVWQTGYCFSIQKKSLEFYDSWSFLFNKFHSSNLSSLVWTKLRGSQHMHKITNLWKYVLNWLLKLREWHRETPLSHEFVCFQMLDFRTSKSNSEVPKPNSNISLENYYFLEKYVTLEGAVSHNVLYYQQLLLVIK